jgi:hypothetical protein
MWTTAVAAPFIVWSAFHAGHGLFGWAWLLVNGLLLESYQSHRIAGTDQGIELRTIWWRELVRWREVASLETRPAYWRRDVLLTNRHDPPWQVVISTPRRKLVVSSQRSIAEAMRADFERMRASRSETEEE